MDIKELIERVEALTGTDREIDALLHAYADGRTVREEVHPQFGRQLIARNSRPPHDKFWLDHPAQVFPPCTSSIDAALSFAERVLPGFRFTMFTDGGGKGPTCLALLNDEPVKAECRAPTLPLAIILATLKAKVAE